ncbi:hypothetical protein LVB87_09020 [Lysobacter sp. KIS68-7]|uniref:AbiU2 domain-containing protein n=1 Tax=Lysobacter sp. KIS68-7 TaxID=2904252 RepID=UPI001E4527A9|nr:hypothetical protein [Lysobacter sp. KIS68-7]UHQ18362.1 hypothetical protein LVB87_09020 [Lysobacter sp. KIS68-7]
MLNEDHRNNLRGRADAVASSIHLAWTYFQILKGMQEASADDPESPLTHPHAYDAIYRAVFHALYLAVGQVTDTRKDVESLNTLEAMARRYPVEREKVAKVHRVVLGVIRPDSDSPLSRLRRWRDLHAAHRTMDASNPAFYVENKLNLGEVEQAIASLDAALSEISWELLGYRYLNRDSTEVVAASCAALLTRYGQLGRAGGVEGASNPKA